MKIAHKLSLFTSLLALSAVPAFANPTISSPGNGADVSSPFTLSADASTCSSQTVSSMGYSLDSSSDTTIVHSTSIDAKVSASSGSHTVHVKAWGDKGAVCVSDVTVTVGSVSASSALTVPSGAEVVSNIEVLTNWEETHDTGTTGTSSGSTTLVTSPSHSGKSRKFQTSFTGNGGERYHVSFGDDTSATNFVYDAWVYIGGSAAHLANIEMDMNQVIPNGDTVIYGFQCDGWNGVWDYTENAGTPTKPVDKWVSTGQACNPRSWGVNAWHHVQVAYSRTSSGVVTYKTVALDGKVQTVNKTAASAWAAGWAPTLLTNLQIDGDGSGSATVYLDELKVSRW
ncbi:MAG TPA: hypothetical protein VHU89_17105 [Acidobacteriaceae bacterium]|nr:hypothetical protein [Acidobacteriaceae bacterium]